MKRRHVFLLGFLLLALAGYLFVFLLPHWVPYNNHAQVQYKDISFDSRFNPTPWGRKVPTYDFPEFEEREIDIRFRMLVYSIMDYDNVFQTAPVNKGIRLELDKPNKLGVVIQEKTGLGGKVRGLFLTQRLQANRWYTVRIHIDRAHHLQAWLNGLSVIDIRNAAWDYSVSDLAVGTGFSHKRPFNGKAEGFSIRYDTWKPKTSFVLAVSSFRTLFAVLSLTAAFILGVDLAKGAYPQVPGLWRAFSAWIHPKIRAENLLLLHFILCSGGLIKLVIQVGKASAHHFSTIAPIPFNEWALFLVFPSKPSDLITYLLAVSALPVYYSIAYLLLWLRRGQAYRFFASVVQKPWWVYAYTAFMLCGNLLVLFSGPLFRSAHESKFAATLWLCLFLAPWYLDFGQAPPAPAEELGRSSRGHTS